MIENKKLNNWGTTVSCLGGLLIILNFTTLKDSPYALEFSILAFLLAFSGLIMINKAKAKKKS